MREKERMICNETVTEGNRYCMDVEKHMRLNDGVLESDEDSGPLSTWRKAST